MKWFEHECDAHHKSKKIRKIREQYKMEGVGRYYTLLEIIGETVGEIPDNDGYLDPDYTMEMLRDDLMFRSVAELKKFLDFLAEIGAICPRAWGETSASTDRAPGETSARQIEGRVRCEQILERCDEYHKKKARKGQSVRTKSGQYPEKSGQCPKNIRLDLDSERDLEEEAEVESEEDAHARGETTTTAATWQACRGKEPTQQECEAIIEWEEAYGSEDVVDAIKEAGSLGNQKVTVRYVETILLRWAEEGKGNGEKPRNRGQPKEHDPEKYFKGKFGHLVQR